MQVEGSSTGIIEAATHASNTDPSASMRPRRERFPIHVPSNQAKQRWRRPHYLREEYSSGSVPDTLGRPVFIGAGGWRASHQSAFVSTGVVSWLWRSGSIVERRSSPPYATAARAALTEVTLGIGSCFAKAGRNSYELGAVSLDATHVRCGHASGLVARPPYPFGTRTHVARAQNWACFPLLHVVDCTKVFDNLSSV